MVEIYIQLPKDPSSVKAGSVFSRRPHKVDLKRRTVTPETPKLEGKVFVEIKRVEEPTSLEEIAQAPEISVVIVHPNEQITNNYNLELPPGSILEIYKS